MDDGGDGIDRHGPGTALVVPVKTLSLAKTRLHGYPRTALMRGFAMDALQSALACAAVTAVYVVTDEGDLAEEAVRLGCTVVPDRGGGDLNRALVVAVSELPAQHLGVAVMLGDLPSLTPTDLGDALTWADGRAAYVADAAGTGTTLLTAGDRARFSPRFGVGSAAAHAAAGYVAVPLPLTGLRQDVDTATDLESALALGVGPHTRAALRSGAEAQP